MISESSVITIMITIVSQIWEINPLCSPHSIRVFGGGVGGGSSVMKECQC